MGMKIKPSVPRRLLTKLIWLLVILVWPVLSSSQQKLETGPMSVPEELQVSIFLKILTYDRSLGERVKDTIRIGVLYFPEDAQSKKNKEAILESLKLNKDKTINGIPFNFMEFEFGSDKRLEEMCQEKRINVFYVTSNGSDIIKRISSITQAKKILTITGRVDYVNHGISVGLTVKEEKPQVVINLPSTKAEGSDFSANLLRLWKVIN
jgi:hypothetical protein